jgi:flagellin-specific chaperone FliS
VTVVISLSNLFAQLQTSIAQKKSHIQVAQKQITQLQHTLTLVNQQGYLISDLQGLYGPYIQKCIQSHIHGNTRGVKSIKNAWGRQIFLRTFARPPPPPHLPKKEIRDKYGNFSE